MPCTNNCPTKTIQDAPANTDTLSQFDKDEAKGPQQRVVDAIVEIIRNEDAGITIGLEGGWGSGKTTVINFLRSAFENDENVTVFTFDAWGHQGDPLRRTFLESLITYFESRRWINRKRWKKLGDRLAKRRRSSRTTIVPIPNTAGILIGALLLLIPTAAAFLTEGLRRRVALFGNEGGFSWVTFFGLIPPAVILVLLCYLGYRVAKKRCQHQHQSGNPNNDKTSGLAFLTGQQITQTRQDVSETPDPTSIEFSHYFRKLMAEALELDQRRVVIVVDNLDRVDPADARAIWSTLQTFLQDRQAGSEAWLKKLWVIVPYDREGMEKIWARTGDDGGADTPPSIDIETPQVLTDPSVAGSFMDKCFQLKFEVPPPVLSNWHQFLNDRLKDALPEHGEDDRDAIRRAFDVMLPYGHAPTPREVILFVNQIGVLHRQWRDVYPLDHMAYYVLLRRLLPVKDLNADLLKPKSSYPQIVTATSIDVRKSLAGLLFNVEPKLGMQLLLRAPIETELKAGAAGADRLENLKTAYPQAFWTVMERIFRPGGLGRGLTVLGTGGAVFVYV